MIVGSLPVLVKHVQKGNNVFFRFRVIRFVLSAGSAIKSITVLTFKITPKILHSAKYIL